MAQLALHGLEQLVVAGEVEEHQRGFGHQIAHEAELAEGLVQIDLHGQRLLDAVRSLSGPGLLKVAQSEDAQQHRAGQKAVAQQPLLKAQACAEAGSAAGLAAYAAVRGRLRRGFGLASGVNGQFQIV